MRILPILINLFLLFFLSCDKNPSDNTSEDILEDDSTEQEINYSICENCIWLQDDCNGKWFLGYNVYQSIGGFQFTIEMQILTILTLERLC